MSELARIVPVEVVMVTDQLETRYDAVVIGGGSAGLSGALLLARSRRSVLVIDAGEPRNAPAGGVHNLLAREGMSPAGLLDRGRAEVRGYGGQVVTGTVRTVTRAAPAADGIAFTVTLADGRTTQARRLLVTSGLVDELPDIPGLRARWGRDVVHCPYCHGWEVRGQPVGVLATSPMSVHQALLFSQLTDDVVFFAHTQPAPGGEQAEQLAARGVKVITGEVTAVETGRDRITGVRLADGTVVPRAAIAVSTRLHVRAGFLAGLGLHPVEHPSGAGDYLPADQLGRTDVPGVWVAGNVTDMMAQVSTAIAAGANAAAQINYDLVIADVTKSSNER